MIETSKDGFNHTFYEYNTEGQKERAIKLTSKGEAIDHFFYDEEGNLEASGEMIAYRGLFLIDKEGTVMHQLVNFFPLGRSVDEAMRMVDALQYFEEKGEVCPANWTPGKEAMKDTHEGVADYLSKN